MFEPPSPAPVPAPAPAPIPPEDHRLARLANPGNAVGPDAGSGAAGVAHVADAAQMAHTGSGGADTADMQPAGHTGGGGAEPALQPQAQPTGKLFRISVLAGKSKEVGGFMQVSHATSACQSPVTLTTPAHGRTRDGRSSSFDLPTVWPATTGVTP